MKNKQLRTLKRVCIYIKKNSRYLVVSMVLSIVMTVLMLYIPILTGEAIDLILGKNNVNFKGLESIIKKIFGCIGVVAISTWIANICNNKLVYTTIEDIRRDVFDKIQRVSVGTIEGKKKGDLVSRVVSDADQFAEGLLMGVSQFFSGVLTIIGTLYFMVRINVKISMVVVLLTPLSLFVASFIAKKTYNMFYEQSVAKSEQTSIVEEMIGNAKLVQAYNYEERVVNKYQEINERLKKCSLKAIFFSSLTNPCTRFVNSLVYTGVGFTGAMAAVKGIISVGELSCFLSYANQYTKPFNEISGVVTELQNALACADRIFELLDYKEVDIKENSIDIENVNGDIEFKNVYFSYLPEQKLIEDLNVNIKEGQSVAIVGPTGCGKTTLINLLMRFYDICKGDIYIDGKNIEDITRESLRKSFGMVLQDTWIKSGTVRENIIMGKQDATDKEIIDAAKRSYAHSFIKRLPRGYDTELGEDGEGLSVGQKQLLAITRVLISNPKMLILDEATSSIDTRTEIKVQRAFDELMKGRTSFIVAHRLSTIINADIILVMKDGNIIEQGKHEQLLKNKGFYYELYNSQFAHL